MENSDVLKRFTDKFNRNPDFIELWWFTQYNRLPSSFEYQQAQLMMIVNDHRPAPQVGEGDCEICGKQAGLNFKTVVSGESAEKASMFEAHVCFDCYSRLGSNDKVYEAILAARDSRKKHDSEPPKKARRKRKPKQEIGEVSHN